MADDRSDSSPPVCPSKSDLLLWCDGELEADSRATVEAHVRACARCREAAEELRGFEVFARGALDRDTPPDDLEPRLEAAFRTTVAASSFGSRRSWRRFGLAWAGAAAVLLTTWLFMRSDGEPTQPRFEVELVDVERAEGGPLRKFRIEVALTEALHVAILSFDGDHALDFLFPFFDVADGSWSWLGHPRSVVARPPSLTVPRETFGSFEVSGKPGARKHVLAAGRRTPLTDGELSRLRRELANVLRGARDSGASSERALEQIVSSLEREFDWVAQTEYVVPG